MDRYRSGHCTHYVSTTTTSMESNRGMECLFRQQNPAFHRFHVLVNCDLFAIDMPSDVATAVTTDLCLLWSDACVTHVLVYFAHTSIAT